MTDLHARLLSLPHTSHRRMFGADCFLARGRMFAFALGDGALVLRLPADQYPRALALPGVEPFTMRGVPFGKWARFPKGARSSLHPWLRRAYEHALAAPAPRKRGRRG